MTTELQKTLETPAREMAVRTWAQTGLMSVLLPKLAARWDKDAERVCALLRAVDPTPWTTALAACLLPLIEEEGYAALGTVLLDFKHRLKFSNEAIEQLKFALHAQAELEQSQQLAWSKLQPLLIDTNITVAINLLRARVAIGEIEAAALDTALTRLALPPTQLNPAPLVDGQICNR